MVIAGDRVRLKPATLAEMATYGGAVGAHYAREIARVHLVDEGAVYILEERATGEVVGGGVVWQTGMHEVEPFGFLHPRYQWRGFAVEGMRLLIDHVFTTMPHVSRIVARTKPRNRAAARVARVVGMQCEAAPLSVVELMTRVSPGDLDTYVITRRRWRRQRVVRQGDRQSAAHRRGRGLSPSR